MVSNILRIALLSTALFLGPVACQQLRGNIRLYQTNNMCDGSDGLWQCGNASPGQCCSIGATSFILSTNTQLTSAPGGGRTTHIIHGAQSGNLCAIVLNSDPACAKTSESMTAQGGSYSWRSNSAGRLRRGEDVEVAASAGEECLRPDTFHIVDGARTYVAAVDNTTISYVASLDREAKLAWAKENGEAL
ncbi:hypothetical protein NKR19_g9854 [Coniochaeta hoffmannii]|uniref:Uncharacterized protein n=1 Tax=Coniochaeta hoffmannii TaxID=91930 RepID=A0AA38R2C2_9PEZI|nr:hypothetical protein NKR19_g9854 [Coniochaeta hoffmannii]